MTTAETISILQLIGGALIALIAAGLTSYFAYHQYMVARAKLRLDLFERRIAIFDTAWTMCSAYMHQGENEPPEKAELQNVLPRAQFLFNSAIREYLSGLLTVATAADVNNRIMRGSTDWAVRYPTASSDWASAIQTLSAAASDGLRAEFSPYLAFERWTDEDPIAKAFGTGVNVLGTGANHVAKHLIIR